jgi:alpha-glucuronidase
MDRTVATGTGYIGQYPPELARRYEDVTTCPEDLLLFLHHVPYTHRMADGKTLIQAFYDEHYEGAGAAGSYPERWEALKGLVDDERYGEVLRLFEYQAGHAVVWRDAVNGWFRRESGIADAVQRHEPLRIEAEAMEARGYQAVDVVPVETASGGKAMACKAQSCSLAATLNSDGEYRIAVQYFDLRNGISRFELLLNGRAIAAWKADTSLPPAVMDAHLDGHTSTRFVSAPVRVRAGDVLMVRGVPQGGEEAAVDYLELIGGGRE